MSQVPGKKAVLGGRKPERASGRENLARPSMMQGILMTANVCFTKLGVNAYGEVEGQYRILRYLRNYESTIHHHASPLFTAHPAQRAVAASVTGPSSYPEAMGELDQCLVLSFKVTAVQSQHLAQSTSEMTEKRQAFVLNLAGADPCLDTEVIPNLDKHA